MDAEVKKRDCKELKWDASYKVPKHLCQYHGKPFFTALITGTNGYGEDRVQFFVVSDSHDQMRGQIKALLDTLQSHGHHGQPQRMSTDNPMETKHFFMAEMPTLREEQKRLDDLASDLPTNEASTAHDEAACTIDVEAQVQVRI